MSPSKLRASLWHLWLFILLIIVARIAGQMYGTLEGGWRGSLAVLFVFGAAFMLYVVAVIILSWLWAGFDRLRGKS